MMREGGSVSRMRRTVLSARFPSTSRATTEMTFSPVVRRTMAVVFVLATSTEEPKLFAKSLSHIISLKISGWLGLIR